jgi:hypothetical protein
MQRGNEDIIMSKPIDGVIKADPVVLEFVFDKEIEVVSISSLIDDNPILKDAITLKMTEEEKYWRFHQYDDSLKEIKKRYWTVRVVHRVKSKGMFVVKIVYKIVGTGEVKEFMTDFFIGIRLIK